MLAIFMRKDLLSYTIIALVVGLVIGFFVGRFYPPSPRVSQGVRDQATGTDAGAPAPTVNPFETTPVNPLQGAGYDNPLKDVKFNPFE